jgi:hypothetical protein
VNRKLSLCPLLVSIAWCLLSLATPAASQEAGPQGRPAPEPGLSLSASYLRQLDADIDGGGDVRVERCFLRLDGTRRQSDTLTLGMGVHYDLADYSFSGTGALPGNAPWDQVHALTLSLSSVYSPDRNWKLFMAPSVGVAAASGAHWNDSLVYGGIVWSSYRIDPALAVGLGAGLFSKQDEFSAFPVIVIDWKISDRLRLSNPRNEGPTGPAGLELTYRIDADASVTAGGAYRSLRFRLDDDGPVPGGIGEDRAFPLWLKFSTGIGKRWTLSLLGGAMTGGTLTVEDNHGNTVQERDYDVAPFLSATISVRFGPAGGQPAFGLAAGTSRVPRVGKRFHASGRKNAAPGSAKSPPDQCRRALVV